MLIAPLDMTEKDDGLYSEDEILGNLSQIKTHLNQILLTMRLFVCILYILCILFFKMPHLKI